MKPSFPLFESPPRPLASSAGIRAVDAMMLRLAVGERVDLAGHIVSEPLRTGGKRLRARLAFACGDALGLPLETLIPWASACEMLHNATLVHDDVQDGDRFRRGHPTVWARYGAGQAINAGDLMLMLPFMAVGEIDAGPTARARLYSAVAQAAAQTVRGQSEEMDLPNRDEVRWEQWVEAAEGKSGALLGLPVQGAAILAGLDDRSARAMYSAFSRAGVLYQLQDDLLDLSLEKGKARRASDVREGKVSALVVAHLELHPSEAADTFALLRSPARRADEAAIEAFIERLFQGGAVAWVQEQVENAARSVLEDPTLRAVPELAGVAGDLVAHVQRAASEIGALAHGSAA